jgi:phenylacetate-CoA ligase
MSSLNWSRDRVKTYEFAHLKDTLEYANRHVPYYRPLWKRLGFDPRDIRAISDFQQLPITEKDVVKANPGLLVSDLFAGKRLYRDQTSGTTGKPLTTYKDKSCYQRTWAFQARQRAIWGITGKRARVTISLRSVVPMTQSEPPYWRHDLTEDNWLFSNRHISDMSRRWLRYSRRRLSAQLRTWRLWRHT